MVGRKLSGPTQTSPASLKLPPGAEFRYLNVLSRYLDSRILDISCPATWSGKGTLNITGSGQLINGQSGVMTIQQAIA